jgi:hypothetical protein
MAASEAVGAERLAALEQRRLALEHARHAAEVLAQRGVGELVLGALQVALERGELGAGVADRLAHAALVAGDQLRQVRDDRAAAQGDRTRVGLVGARQQPQQRRLPRPVCADQAHACAGREVEVETVEDAPAAERLDDAASAQRGGGGGGADGHGTNIRRPLGPMCAANPTLR